MTNKLPLSKEDLKFLINLLDGAEEEANTEIRIDGDNKAEATLAIERISRIRLAITDDDDELEEEQAKKNEKEPTD